MKMLEFVNQKSDTSNGAIERAVANLFAELAADQQDAPAQAHFFGNMFTTLAYVQQFGLPDDLADYFHKDDQVVPNDSDFPHWSEQC